MVEILAPANIKLAGEHSVVYGTDIIAAAVNKFASTKAVKILPDYAEITLVDDQFRGSSMFDSGDLKNLYRSWQEKKDIASFIAKNSHVRVLFEETSEAKASTTLAFAHVLSRLDAEFGVPVLKRKFYSHSDVPTQKGWASSTSIGASFVGAVLAEAKVTLNDSEIIDVMRDVDRILHINPNAGGIDVPPAYYGGYVFGSPKSGYTKINVPEKLNFIAVNVGPKESTSDMVKLAGIRSRTYPTKTKQIVDSIQSVVVDERLTLENQAPVALGNLMFYNHKLLVELGVSSEKLDEMVDIARSHGALGAKMVGGGGGGGGLVFCDPGANRTIIDAMRKAGFEAEIIEVTDIGVKKQIEDALRQ